MVKVWRERRTSSRETPLAALMVVARHGIGRCLCLAGRHRASSYMIRGRGGSPIRVLRASRLWRESNAGGRGCVAGVPSASSGARRGELDQVARRPWCSVEAGGASACWMRRLAGFPWSSSQGRPREAAFHGERSGWLRAPGLSADVYPGVARQWGDGGVSRRSGPRCGQGELPRPSDGNQARDGAPHRLYLHGSHLASPSLQLSAGRGKAE